MRETTDLDCIDDLRADKHGVDAEMRSRSVGAHALDIDGECIRRRHHRSGPDAKGANRHTRIIVHAVDFTDAETIQHSVVEHRLGARTAFFCRLKDHHCSACKVAGVGEVARGAEQHGRVAIMAAGVHLARHGRLVRKIIGLFDRQRIHVGAQPDRLASRALAPANDADHAGSSRGR